MGKGRPFHYNGTDYPSLNQASLQNGESESTLRQWAERTDHPEAYWLDGIGNNIKEPRLNNRPIMIKGTFYADVIYAAIGHRNKNGKKVSEDTIRRWLRERDDCFDCDPITHEPK